MSVVDALPSPPGSEAAVLRLLDNMIWPILALTVVGAMVLVPGTFRNVRSVELVIHSSVGLGFLVLAESICLISGHFDLSVGSIAGFSAMFAALALSPSQWGLVSSPAVGVVLICAVGTAVGVANGLMISKLGINPFLQTLAALIIFEGLKISLSSLPVSDLPEGYTTIGSTPEIAIAALFVTFLIAAVVMRFTPFGQAIYGLGSEEESARAVGIDTDRLVTAVYAVSGFLSAIGGLMLTGFTASVSPQTGSGLVFPAFAAAVIGGVSLFGGRGKVSGALGGVLLLGVIQSALNLSGIGVAQIQAVNGFLSAIGGLMLTGFTASVSPQTGSGLVFPAFAAAVIGGVSLFGGRGKVSGALGGVLLLGVIQSALNLSGIGVAQIQAVNGFVLLIAILLYNTRTNIRERVLAAEV